MRIWLSRAVQFCRRAQSLISTRSSTGLLEHRAKLSQTMKLFRDLLRVLSHVWPFLVTRLDVKGYYNLIKLYIDLAAILPVCGPWKPPRFINSTITIKTNKLYRPISAKQRLDGKDIYKLDGCITQLHSPETAVWNHSKRQRFWIQVLIENMQAGQQRQVVSNDGCSTRSHCTFQCST